jgi:hypothetical protein
MSSHLINIADVGERDEQHDSTGPVSKRAIYDAWEAASAKVRRFEQELAALWDQAAQKLGPPPSPEMFQELSRLRKVADERLNAFIRLMKQDP